MKILLVSAAALVGLFVAAPAHAQLQPVNEGGDYQHCVTYDEFLAFHIGMREHHVQRVFDTKGRRVSGRDLAAILGTVNGPDVGQGSTVRSYQGCDDGGRVLVEFNPRRRAQAGSYGV